MGKQESRHIAAATGVRSSLLATEGVMTQDEMNREEAVYPVQGSDEILNEASRLLESLYGEELAKICIERIVVGVFCTGVKLTNGCGGIAYTPPEAIQQAGNRVLKGSVSIVRGMPVGKLLADRLPGPFTEVIRLATLNALSAPFLNSACWEMGAGNDVTAYPQLIQGKRICMVGAIIPVLKQLKEFGITSVTIIDKKLATRDEADFGHFVPVSETAKALSQCDTAIFTGASIANGTIEGLIRSVPRDAAIIVVGPTAGFVPDPLFRRNVALIDTVVVTESDHALDILAEGGGAHQLFRDCLRKISFINPLRMSKLLENSAF
jgi:uncharacterized protein